MPMPMPIMVASEVDQSGASMSAISTPVRVLLTASPAMATMRGSPAATTDPNISSRMIAAAAKPIASEPISAASPWVMVCPPSATSRPGRLASSAIAIIFSLSATGTSTGFTTSSLAWATRVRPSGEIAPGVVNGSSTEATCGWSPRSASSACTSARVAGSSRPPSARTTMSTVSPDWDGKRDSSSCCASLESEPGAE